jgi:hypothetical protein
MLPHPTLSRLNLHQLGTAPERSGLDRLTRLGPYRARAAQSSPNDTRQIRERMPPHSDEQPRVRHRNHGQDASIRTPGYSAACSAFCAEQGTVRQRPEDYWTLRERFEQGKIDIDPDDDKLAAQLGSIKWGIDSRVASRSNRKTTYVSEACRPRIGQTRWP